VPSDGVVHSLKLDIGRLDHPLRHRAAERPYGRDQAAALLRVAHPDEPDGGQAVSADALASALWGDSLPSKPADQVAVLVSRLRSVLGAERLPRSDAGYQLLADWIDLDVANHLATAASRRLAAQNYASARLAAEAALALMRGDLLVAPRLADVELPAPPVSAAARVMIRPASAPDHSSAVREVVKVPGTTSDQPPWVMVTGCRR